MIFLSFLFFLGANAFVKGLWFDHIFIMQFENTGFPATARNPAFAALGEKGRVLTQYYAVTHPSQPNYWTQVAGSFFGHGDDDDHDLDYSHLADQLDQKHVTWKTYQEDYPGNCFTGTHYQRYVRKHNPFISFVNVQNNATRCKNIVNSNQLDIDLANGQLPQYSYYTPNMDNDAHDSDIAFAGRYLANFFTSRLDKFPASTLIVVTFDEDWFMDDNRVYTILVGDMIPPKSTDDTRYDHYSLLRTVQDNWELGTLGRNDATAVPFNIPTQNPDGCLCNVNRCTCCYQDSILMSPTAPPLAIDGCVGALLHFDDPLRASVALILNGQVLLRKNYTANSNNDPLCGNDIDDLGIQMCVALREARMGSNFFSACPELTVKTRNELPARELLKHTFNCFKMKV